MASLAHQQTYQHKRSDEEIMHAQSTCHVIHDTHAMSSSDPINIPAAEKEN